MDVGTHVLRLIITDDDGANVTREMDIIVSEKPVSTEDGFNTMAILLLVSLLGTVVFYVRRKRLSEYESSSMPKWNNSRKSTSGEGTNTEQDENVIWTDSNASSGGKD
jgi:hypothetical protein